MANEFEFRPPTRTFFAIASGGLDAPQAAEGQSQPQPIVSWARDKRYRGPPSLVDRIAEQSRG